MISEKFFNFLTNFVENPKNIRNFADEIKLNNNMMAITREQALARFQRAKLRKRECIDKLEKTMKVAYEKRTGKTADYFFAL